MLEYSKIILKYGTTILIVYLIVDLIKFSILNVSNFDFGSIISTFIAVLGIVLAIYLNLKSKEHERENTIILNKREYLIPIYENFIKFYLELLITSKVNKKEKTLEEMVNFNAKFTKDIMSWGSEEFIKEYGKYRILSLNHQTDPNPKQLIESFGDLLILLRKDMHMDDKNIKSKDLLRLFLTDIDTFLK